VSAADRLLISRSACEIIEPDIKLIQTTFVASAFTGRRESFEMDRFPKLRSTARIIGALALILIAGLSLVPGELRPHTDAPKQYEHFAAYFAAAVILSFGFGKSRSPLLVALFLSIYAAALELAQIGVPGRDGNFYDFVISSTGAIDGCFLAWIVMRALPKAFA
jgi:VanZ family protein